MVSCSMRLTYEQVVEVGWLEGMKSVLLATYRGKVALFSTVAAGLVASLAFLARVLAVTAVLAWCWRWCVRRLVALV